MKSQGMGLKHKHAILGSGVASRDRGARRTCLGARAPRGEPPGARGPLAGAGGHILSRSSSVFGAWGWERRGIIRRVRPVTIVKDLTWHRVPSPSHACLHVTVDGSIASASVMANQEPSYVAWRYSLERCASVPLRGTRAATSRCTTTRDA
jgi:hypothetical protein